MKNAIRNTTKKATILIVEDDRDLREALETTVEMAGFHCVTADSAEAAIPMLENQLPDMVVSDVNMPGMDGLGLLDHIQSHFPGLPAVLMTAYGQISQAVSSIQAGAIDYLVKPFDPKTLINTIRRVVAGETQHSDTDPVAVDAFSRRLFQMARKVAAVDSTVLISGESGTGKEVLARFIHASSDRSDQPFVAINCAAIPENMLEAILFGHEKGAFTGAYASTPGKFEQANGGTILLDEISEMDPGLQAKLLRVLQEKEVERVGGRKPVPLDVRVLATTNRDLKEYVSKNRFREDLYYRLSVFPIHWKPLRERPADIVPLAERLLRNHTAKMKLPQLRFSQEAQAAMVNHSWPGNVRELDNAIQRAIVLQQGGEIGAEELCLDGTGHSWMNVVDANRSESRGDSGLAQPDESGELPVCGVAVPDQIADERASEFNGLGGDLKRREFQIIIDTIKKCGKRKLAAERLGISPRTLRYKLAQMRDYGIDIESELSVA
ncbi:MAG: sigma-54-dependent Fis family transcriptional regulator [Gammaproteobacteria bacterium]|nr:MAG: sigma-54-dependent Fis family transcriptional regulator [Pseudomonadota bacterium]PIE38133.1 MAG: sigma-54-dependent Fis family transcriptional regulator [Gammaproteobacteria bacterium]